MIRFERLERVESERQSYIAMLDYFMEKHRYGVFQTGFGGGVKDMYLIPLSFDDPPPVPLQPFSGPGEPVCLSVRLSVRLSVHLSVCSSVCLFVCLSVRLSVCLFVRLSVCSSVSLDMCV